MGEIPHEVGVLPLHDLGHGVSAGDEEQFGVRVLCADIAQRVDGVGHARTVDVHAGNGELGVGRRGDHGHQITVLSVGDFLIELEHGPARRHENHLVKIVDPGDFGCGDQVAVVNRVERAAHNANAQARMPVASGRQAPPAMAVFAALHRQV